MNKFSMKLLSVLLFGSLFFSIEVDAATYNDGDACGGVGEPPAGSFYRENTVDGYHFLVCDGTTWNLSQIVDFTLNNTSVGNNALDSITTGTNNVAVGNAAGSSVTTGNNLVFIGSDISTSNGDGVVAIGRHAGRGAGTGTVAIGYNAGEYNGGANNVILGARACSQDTNNTVALGYASAWALTGDNNVVLGHNAAGANVSPGSTGEHNTMVGRRSGYNVTTGNNNVFFGYNAADLTTTGSDNIIIGFDIDASSATASDELNIGETIYGDLSSDFIGFANASPDVEVDVTGSIEFTGTIADVSDRRLKKKIYPIRNALTDIQKLRGVSFVMKDNEEQDVELGLIAQDVQKVFPDLVENRSGTLSLNYQGMTGPLVEAIKELDIRNQKLRTLRDSLEARVSALEGS